MRKKNKIILRMPQKNVSMRDYQEKGFAALDKVLQSNNGAALVAAAKMIFEATGLLKPENTAPPETMTVEFGVTQPRGLKDI